MSVYDFLFCKLRYFFIKNIVYYLYFNSLSIINYSKSFYIFNDFVFRYLRFFLLYLKLFLIISFNRNCYK